jgi:hypothetical protein
MTIIIIILAIIGLAGIVMGFASLFWARSLSNGETAPQKWKRKRIIVLLIGILIGAASWPGTYFMGYPYKAEEGYPTGRVVGIPIMVAYFDSEGRDYTFPFTMASVLGNGLFWFFLPHLIVVTRKKIRCGKGRG